MVMEVQKYLRQHGLQKLVDEFHIVVTDYPDRCVLNYDQIDSPNFVPVIDECRALILRKDDWSVMSRAFDRFYNVGHGEKWKEFKVSLARIDTKIDGSIMSVYFDGKDWCVSTRKMAFAEGTSTFGKTFRELFNAAAIKTGLWHYLDDRLDEAGEFTWIFEITSPESRVVHPYADTEITLIGGRQLASGDEVMGWELDHVAELMSVKRPEQHSFNNIDEVTTAAQNLEVMDEGYVLVMEQSGSFFRLKCKNPKFVAIAHMRENGGISPKRILTLIMANEKDEYLSYFETDKSYFDFVEVIYKESVNRINTIASNHMQIASQKYFALAIMPLTKYDYERGVLFSMRKGASLKDALDKMGAKKLALALNLRKKFADEFKVETEEDNDA